MKLIIEIDDDDISKLEKQLNSIPPEMLQAILQKILKQIQRIERRKKKRK